MADKKNTRRLRLPVRAGLKTDGFAEDVPLIDVNDYVLLPDGSGIAPREGYEIRRTDSVGVGATRKTIYFIPDPPDLSGGDLLVIQNNKYGDRRVETVELVQSAQLEATVNYAPSYFGFESQEGADPVEYEVTPPIAPVQVNISRKYIAGIATVRVQSADGTAVAGSDYTAVDETLTFEDGDSIKPVFVTVGGAVVSDKDFTLHLTGFSTLSSYSSEAGAEVAKITLKAAP